MAPSCRTEKDERPSRVRTDLAKRKLEKWLLNYARNASKRILVAPAITTRKLNAPRRLAAMRSKNRVMSHPKARKIEVRYVCKGGVRAPEEEP